MRLAEAIADPTRSALVITLAYTGLRWSEAIGLRVRDVNPLRRRLHVRRVQVELDGIFYEGEPKNWERRTVPFPRNSSGPHLDDVATRLDDRANAAADVGKVWANVGISTAMRA